MRIVLNLHGYTPGSGGVETYLVNLIKAIQNLAHQDEFVLLCDRRAQNSFPVFSPSFSRRVDAYDRPGRSWFLRESLKKLTGVDLLGKTLRKVEPDLVHHPLTVLNPLRAGVPSVLTFHDLQQEYFPQFFSPEELRQRRKCYKASLDEAVLVIAISHHCKAGLVEKYGVPPEKISVIHHGVSELFRRPALQGEVEAVRRRFGIDRPFMIYPASTWPHKNHLGLLKAVKILIDQRRFDGELILTGGEKQGHCELLAEIDRLGMTDRCRWLGYVSGQELNCFYQIARCMVFPSLFEGFGLPVLEAMARGCPVVCANTTSLPELTGPHAAQLFDPHSIEEMAEAIADLWNDDARCQKLVRLGKGRAELFSWDKTAEMTMDVYRRACSLRGF